MAGISIENDQNQARENMVSGQLIANRIGDPAMLRAIGRVKRELFLPERLKGRAYADESFRIDAGRVMFSPRILANLLLAAELRPDDFVLNVKSGTGYSAAVMAGMTRAVVAIDADAALCETAQQIMIDSEIDNVAVLNSDPAAGFAAQSPFDAIFIDGIVSKIPDALPEQLAENGRLVCVVAPAGGATGRATKVVRKNGGLSFTTPFDLDIGGLTGANPDKNFIFEAVS